MAFFNDATNAQKHHVASVFFHGISSVLLLVFTENERVPAVELKDGSRISNQFLAFFAGTWSTLSHIFQVWKPTWPTGDDDSKTYYVPPRWIDYTVSASLMVTPVLVFTGQREPGVLVASSLLVALSAGIGAGYTEHLVSEQSKSSCRWFWIFGILYDLAWYIGIFYKRSEAFRVLPSIVLLHARGLRPANGYLMYSEPKLNFTTTIF